MNNVNITEKYALCMLKEKKTLHEKELSPYLIVSMIVEMMLEGDLEITDNNKVILNNRVPTASYNQRLYDSIKDMKKEEIPLKYVLKAICYTLSNKKLKSIISVLKEKMVEDELITLETKKGIIGNKEVIKINEECFTNIINEVKIEFLEKGTLTEDLILLASLLDSTKFLKNIFSKYEKEKVGNILNELKDTEIAKKIKVAQAAIREMSALVAAMMINAAGVH